MKKVIYFVFLTLFCFPNYFSEQFEAYEIEFQNSIFRTIRTSETQIEPHQFVIPTSPGQGIIGEIQPHPNRAAQVIPVVGGVSEDILESQELQKVVIPAVVAAIAAWTNAGMGRDIEDKDVLSSIRKEQIDGIAVKAVIDTLCAIAGDDYVFVTESSEGSKDRSVYIPMGYIFTGEGRILPEVSKRILGHLPYTVGDVLKVIEKIGGETPKYVVAINYDPVECTDNATLGAVGSYSLMGATFYPVGSAEAHNAKIHYAPDKGFYLAGYSWYGDVTDIEIEDPPSVVAERISEGDVSDITVAFLGGKRLKERHRSIFDDVKSKGINMITPADGDAILRVLSVTGAIPDLGLIFTCGASGTTEASVGFKTAMIFNKGHAMLTYVPSSVNQGDLLDFLQNFHGEEKFADSPGAITQLQELQIPETHYLKEFYDDEARLPEGAFNIVAFVPITGARESVVGSFLANALPGVQTSHASSGPESAIIKEPSDIDVQVLVALRFPEDDDGKLFVLSIPYHTPNLAVVVNSARALTNRKLIPVSLEPEE